MTRILSFLAILLIVTLIVGIWYLQSLPEKQASLPEAPKHITVKNTPAPIVEKTTKISLREVCFKLEDELGNALSHASIELKHRNNGNKKVFQSNETGYCTINVQQKDDPVFSFHHQSCFSKINVSLSAFPGNTDTPQRIILPRKLMIAGTILSGTKQIEGATISIHSATTEYDVPQEEMPSSTQSIQQGQFELSPLPAGDYILFVSHPEYLPHYEKVKAGNTNLIIELNQSAKIIVHVVDDNDNPIGAASINCRSKQGVGRLTIFNESTNIHGIVEFENLPPSIYTIKASAPEVHQSTSVEVDVSHRDFAEIRLVMQSIRFSLSGKVLDSITNQGISSATVVCESNKMSREFCMTDDTGSFKFTERLPGIYTLFVEKINGYISGNYSSFKSYGANEPVKVAHRIDEDVDDIILWLKPAWNISGKVLTKDGEPLPNAEVSLWLCFEPDFSVGYKGSKQMGKTIITKEDGEYSIDGTFEFNENVSEVFVRAKHAFYGFAYSENFKPSPGDHITPVDIQYKKDWNVFGTVKDEKGNGIENAIVYFYIPQPNSHDIHVAGLAETNNNGEYAEFLEPGNYRCYAESTGYLDTQKKEDRKITIQPNKKNEVNFILNESDTEIEGFVLNSKRQPVDEADIYVTPYSEKKKRSKFAGENLTQTNEQGEFKFDPSGHFWPMEAKAYRITAVPKSDYEPKTIDGIHDGQKSIEIIVDSKEDLSFEIYGQVIDPQGQPVDRFDLTLIPGHLEPSSSDYPIIHDHYQWTTVQTPNGVFHLSGDNASESPFRVAVYHPDYNLAFSEPLYMEAEESRRNILIQMKPTVSLQGRLISELTNEGVPNAQVRVLISNRPIEDFTQIQDTGFSRRFEMRGSSREQAWLQPYLPQTRTDEHGNFILQSLPNIPFWLAGFHPGHKTMYKYFDLKLRTGTIQAGDIILQSRNREIPNRNFSFDSISN